MDKRSAKILLTEENVTEEWIDDSDYFNGSTLEPITVNYDEYGVHAEPNKDDLQDVCEMYNSFPKSTPYEVIDYLAKIMIRVESWDHLFTLEVFRHLCRIDEVIDAVVRETDYKQDTTNHSFNLPYYALCLNLTTPNVCEALNQQEQVYCIFLKKLLPYNKIVRRLSNNKLTFSIDVLKETLFMCHANSSSSPACSYETVMQAMHYLMPKDWDSKHKLIAVVLKVPMFHNSFLPFYELLADRLREHFFSDSKLHGLELKGLAFNLKENIFQTALISDSKFALISAILVLGCCLLFSQNIIFTGIVLLTVVLSIGLGFYIYSVLLGIDFFPFINLLVLVLMIAIGADDAFVLSLYYRNEKTKLSYLHYEVGHPYLPIYKEIDALRIALRNSLRHSLLSMFVTSATTAIAFLTNLTSSIIVLRCFGIFACSTVFVNYLLVLLLLPSTILLTENSHVRQISCKCHLPLRLANFSNNFRFAIISIGSILTALSVFLIFIYPGMSLSGFNPTKVLVSSNLHEYFDDHSHLFDFEWKRSFWMIENYIFGIEVEESASAISPYKRAHKIQSDFRPNRRFLKKIQRQIKEIINKQHNRTNYESWTSLFLDYNSSCIYDEIIPNECLLNFAAGQNELPSSFPEDRAVLPSDGPILDENMNLLGYYVSVQSEHKLTIDHTSTKALFQTIDQNCEKLKTSFDMPIICMSSAEITRFYDIINTMSSSTVSSVVLSLLISLLVVALCTRHLLISILSILVISSIILIIIALLLLFGWQLSVVESTIIVLVIGLSFDYSLHYAIALKESVDNDIVVKLRDANSKAGLACLLGAATSILAGVPLFFTQTAAFFQIGTMLVVLGVVSFAGALVLFPASIALVINFTNRDRRPNKTVIFKM